MQKGIGLGQLQHSFNNLSLETATMPPNVKDILNRRGDAIVNSIKKAGHQFNQQYKGF